MKITKLTEHYILKEDIMSVIGVNGKKLIQWLEKQGFKKTGQSRGKLHYSKDSGKNSIKVLFNELDIRITLTNEDGSKETPFEHTEIGSAVKFINKNLKNLDSGEFNDKVKGSKKLFGKKPKSADEIRQSPIRREYESDKGNFRKIASTKWEFTPKGGKDTKVISPKDVINHFFPTDSKETKDNQGNTKKDDLGNKQYDKKTGIVGQTFKNTRELIKICKKRYNAVDALYKGNNTFSILSQNGDSVGITVEPTRENKNGKPTMYQIKSVQESVNKNRRTDMKINKLLESKKDVSNKKNEALEKEDGPFWYFTKHGMGPGMLPKGVNVVDTKEDDNFGTYIALDKVLSTQELKDYELEEKKPGMKESKNDRRYNVITGTEYDDLSAYGYYIKNQIPKATDGVHGWSWVEFPRLEDRKKISYDAEFYVDDLKWTGDHYIAVGNIEKIPELSDEERIKQTDDRIAAWAMYNSQRFESMQENTSKYGRGVEESLKESRPDKEQSNTPNKKVTIKYGNSVKEVETCKPIKVTNKQLQDYRDNYSQVTIVESKSIKTFGAKCTKCSYKESFSEGWEPNPNNADISWRPYDNEKGQVMADKWYASKYPDDEIGIEQLKGITLDDALEDRSILGHCDTQVRERVYAQLDKYIPLSKESPMYREVNESATHCVYFSMDGGKTQEIEFEGTEDECQDYIEKQEADNEFGNEAPERFVKRINEARRRASDPKQIQKAETAMFDSLMCGSYNTEMIMQEARMIYGITYQESMDAFRKAYNRYMIESGELDEDIQLTSDELKTNYGTDNVDIINAGKPEEERVELKEIYDDNVDDLSYYYNEEDIIDALNDVWEEVQSKLVADSNGFMTDYTMYRNINTGEYVFVFGDKDIYRPEDGYFDWECETEQEATEWFDNYNGFDDFDDETFSED